jgi:hypothetical protein
LGKLSEAICLAERGLMTKTQWSNYFDFRWIQTYIKHEQETENWTKLIGETYDEPADLKEIIKQEAMLRQKVNLETLPDKILAAATTTPKKQRRSTK